MQSKHKQTKCEHSRQTLTDYSFLSRYHYSKLKNYLKDGIEFVTEFPCLLGHPVHTFEDYKALKYIYHKIMFL